MADLAKELEELHAAVVRTVRSRIDNIDGEINNDDLRVALQLLKQNAVTANLAQVDTDRLKSKMAGKLNFSALQEKVIPLRQQPAAAPRHTSDEAQQA